MKYEKLNLFAISRLTLDRITCMDGIQNIDAADSNLLQNLIYGYIIAFYLLKSFKNVQIFVQTITLK